ncbi:hypothetical protein O181_127955 [Austropuccinia psidii MF-1]|uniref:Uncharacterized protein n=1 Tax=Austropuccinia psidii MF-1 TaxID=1389203 RepID=A0A9Q3KU73_9BASI|nr:hypothetical protein [Austropuccinia psidii MF-1]
MRPKGGSQVDPKPQLDPPVPKLATNPLDPKSAKDLLDTNLAINPAGPIFGHGPPWTIFPAMASGNHQRHQTSSASLFPNSREILSFLHALRTQGCRSGAYMVLYTIMHHSFSAIQW